MATRATTNIKKANWQAAYRSAAAFTEPNALADWTTFLATFTQFGYCEKGTLKTNITKSDEVDLDDNTVHVIGFDGTIEGKLLQMGETDMDAALALEGTSIDILFYDTTALRAVFVPTIRIYFDEENTGGEVQALIFKGERKGLGSRSAFRTHFDIPTS